MVEENHSLPRSELGAECSQTSGLGRAIDLSGPKPVGAVLGTTENEQPANVRADKNLSQKKVRKPYTISKQRERWSDEEHQRFVDGIKLYGRQWRKVQAYVGTKTSVQIRSHAQKFFDKVEKQQASGNQLDASDGICIPPPRPKRKPRWSYPKKGSASDGPCAGELTFSSASTAMEGGSAGSAAERSVTAVALAASVAAAAAASAVVAAADEEVRMYLQEHPPQGFPFFGVPPSVLGYLCTKQMPQVPETGKMNDVAAAIVSQDAVSHRMSRTQRLGTNSVLMDAACSQQDRTWASNFPALSHGGPIRTVMPGLEASHLAMKQCGPAQLPAQVPSQHNFQHPPIDGNAWAAMMLAAWHLMHTGQNASPWLQAAAVAGGTQPNDLPTAFKMYEEDASTECVSKPQPFPELASLPNTFQASATALPAENSTAVQNNAQTVEQLEHVTGRGFGQLLAPSSTRGLGSIVQGSRPNIANCEVSSTAQASAPGNGDIGVPYVSVQSPATNLNESFAGSNVVYGGAGPSKEASLSSLDRASEGGKSNTHNGQSAWRQVEGGWGGHLQGWQELVQSFHAAMKNQEQLMCRSSSEPPLVARQDVDCGSASMLRDTPGCEDWAKGQNSRPEVSAWAGATQMCPSMFSTATCDTGTNTPRSMPQCSPLLGRSEDRGVPTDMNPQAFGFMLTQLTSNPYVWQSMLAQVLAQSQNPLQGQSPGDHGAMNQQMLPGAGSPGGEVMQLWNWMLHSSGIICEPASSMVWSGTAC